MVGLYSTLQLMCLVAVKMTNRVSHGLKEADVYHESVRGVGLLADTDGLFEACNRGD